MRRTRLLLVVGLLAGALVLGTTGAARAATEFSDTDGWSFSWGYSGIGGVSCTGAVRWKVVDGTAVSLIGETKCRTTGSISGLGGFDSGSTTSLIFTGQRVGIGGGAPGPGPACTFGTGALSLSGDPATAAISIPGSLGCTIDTVCQTVDHVRDSMMDDQHRQKCTSMALGEAPVGEEENATCNQGDVLPPSAIDLDGEGTTGYPSYLPLGRYRFILTPGEGYVGGTGFGTYLVLSNGYISGGTPVNGNNGGWFTTAAGLSDSDGDGPLTYPPEATVVGIGLYAYGGSYGPGVSALPQNNANGRVGITDPSKCAFYWGQKVAVTTGDDLDEPLGALPFGSTPDPDTEADDPEDDTDNGCDFSFTDPTSWASAGICQLVSLIRDLINAVQGIAGDILDGLRGVFEGLFVPDDLPSFSDVDFDIPTGWVPSMPALTDGSCGALTLPSVSLGDVGGASSSTELIDTCDAPWPTVRTFTYNGLLALVLVGLARAVFRMLMKAAGMEVESSRDGDDE